MQTGEIEEGTITAPEDPQQLKTSLFPLLPSEVGSHQGNTATPCWLSNPSFTAELSIIDDATSSQPARSTTAQLAEEMHEDEEEHANADDRSESKHPLSYKLLESSTSDWEHDPSVLECRKKGKKRRKHRLLHQKDSTGTTKDYGFYSRKPNVQSWTSSNSKPTKEYYFDSKGDGDNLAFGCLYKMDVARYKHYNSIKSWELDFHELYQHGKKNSVLDSEADVDGLDSKLKSAGRYWSVKYAVLEQHKNLKRLRLVAPKNSMEVMPCGDFIPLPGPGMSLNNACSESLNSNSVIEESWEDVVLRKTREFNKMSRERPHDEKVWLSFAEFQDKVASMQSVKGARLQTLEKKISILEKATELNPDNEELWLELLKAYENRDNADALFGRWEKILIQQSGSLKLWKEFLRVCQKQFSRFKVSDMRKMFANAIQALSAACIKHHRQPHLNTESQHLDPEIVQLELGLVDIFVSLCRFEWQAGYQELATALFQAESEYSLFCPSLLLTEQSKQHLFEHFWNGKGARIGEDGAIGWSMWLEKEEESLQRIIPDMNYCETDKGGWTGWSMPLCNNREATIDPENVSINDEDMERSEGLHDTDDAMLEDDAETLLKMLGIDAGAEAAGDVQDVATWARWSEEELSRDCEQWMPLRAKSSATSSADGTPDAGADGHLLRLILFEDVSEYLFTLMSGEARFSLVSQFIDFYGGKTSQFCTNSLSWNEKILSSEVMPDCILEDLRRVGDVDSSLGFLLGDLSFKSRGAGMCKFVRNVSLLCLTAFPRNYRLEEAALVGEELSNTKMDSRGCTVTPCQALAKFLLKNDRRDVLLCGVYARREAAFGNIDHARRVFDMALSSVEGLPLDLRSNAPLLYFWYAELELAIGNLESSSRAIHILSTFGRNASYVPYKCQPSSLELLKARQGFMDRMKMHLLAWARGVVDDYSVSFICSAALFEDLTCGLAAAIDVLTHAFSVVLPEAKSHSHQLEFVFNYHVQMLCRHQKQLDLSKVWGSVTRGLQIYPSSPRLLGALLEIGRLYTVPVKLRRVLDDYYHHSEKLSVVVCLFAVFYEICRGNNRHRIRGLLERALADEKLRGSVLLWRCFIGYEVGVACDHAAARRAFFRGVHACPWSKKLWLDGFVKLSSVLSLKELSDLQEVMRDKELNLRTDVYEILLQDEIR